MKIYLILSVLILSGCAKLSYKPKFFVNNPKESRALETLAAKLTWEKSEDIRVFHEQLPKGLTRNKKGKIRVLKSSKYRYLGKVYAQYNKPELIGFYDYAEDQDWRRGVCHFQQPFGWITLGVWYLLPTYWPCFVSDSSNDEDAIKQRRERMTKTMKKMVKAMGGHILIIDNFADLKSNLTDETVQDIGAVGYAFELKTGR